MKQKYFRHYSFQNLGFIFYLVTTNHLKPNQDRLEFRVYITKKSSRRSIIYLEDIYIYIFANKPGSFIALMWQIRLLGAKY